MGNTQTKQGTNRQVEVMHEKFKMVEVMENMQEMILTIPYEQKSDIVEWQKLLKNVRDCDPQFLLMPKKYMITEQGLCGSSGVIKIVYDCFTYSFEDEIKNHAEKLKYFQQTEIWYLLFAIISAVKEMDRLGMKVGDIRPSNIFVNDNGQVKLAGVYSWPRQVQNFLKTSYDKLPTYLSPDQLHQCRTGQKPKRSHILNESFSVGLTLLHTCLLKDMQGLYNLKRYEFNVEKLQYQLGELGKLAYWNQEKGRNQKYSEELVGIIGGLVEVDEGRRLTTVEIFNLLQPHAEQILNLRQFQLPTFPSLTPTKPQPQSLLISTSLQHHKSSPQYSSIPKKDFHQPQSIAFDTNPSSNYPPGLITSSVKDKFTGQQQGQSIISQQQIISNNSQERRTPEKKTVSRQKLHVSLSNEKRQSIFAKTQQVPQFPRQSVSRQKFNSKLQTNFPPPVSVVNTIQKEQSPSKYQYKAEYKIYDGQKEQQQQFQAFKPPTAVGFAYPPGKYEAPSMNYTTSGYVNYQQRYEIPSNQQIETRPSLHPQVTPQFSYKPSIPQPQTTNYPTSGNYPFPKNIQFVKTDYTNLGPNSIRGTELSHRPSIVGATQQNATYVGNAYQTSMVKPVLPGQVGLSTGFEGLIEPKMSGDSSDLLKRIDQQLNKSKQLYSNGTSI